MAKNNTRTHEAFSDWLQVVQPLALPAGAAKVGLEFSRNDMFLQRLMYIHIVSYNVGVYMGRYT